MLTAGDPRSALHAGRSPTGYEVAPETDQQRYTKRLTAWVVLDRERDPRLRTGSRHGAPVRVGDDAWTPLAGRHGRRGRAGGRGAERRRVGGRLVALGAPAARRAGGGPP